MKIAWMRYSLRTLVTCVALLCIGLAVAANRAARQRDVVREVRALGASVEYEYGVLSCLESVFDADFLANVSVIHVSRHDTDWDALILCLHKLPKLRSVQGSWILGNDLDHLKKSLSDVEFVFVATHGGVI